MIMHSTLDRNEPNYFVKRLKEKEMNRMEDYKNGVVVNNFTGARERAKVIGSNPPKPL